MILLVQVYSNNKLYTCILVHCAEKSIQKLLQFSAIKRLVQKNLTGYNEKRTRVSAQWGVETILFLRLFLYLRSGKWQDESVEKGPPLEPGKNPEQNIHLNRNFGIAKEEERNVIC